jgi:hypothetical protein
MTRQTRFVMSLVGIIALIGLSPATYAQHQWTSLDGPYWTNGIDVAYGMSGLGQDWHRYLIGTDGSDRRPFYWDHSEERWFDAAPLPTANKLISYKNSGSGHYAVCSAYDDDIYLTENGGSDWGNLIFPETFNRHFSSVEIVNWTQNPGQIILVGSVFQDGLASAYYTEDSGLNWLKLGASTDPLDNLQVYDIETFPEISDPPNMAAGTSDGIYVKIGDAWDDSWQPVNFQGSDVPALETIDGWDTGQQLAAVEEGPEGRCNLYYSNPQGDTRWESPVEITPNGESFGRRVRDLSAIYWGYYHVSCYTATDEGLFLITYSDPAQATYYDLEYSPLLYDIDVQSLDYRFLDLVNEDDTAYVLVTTNYNVYEIKETRNSNHEITFTSVSEIVTGTYLCNVVGVSFHSKIKRRVGRPDATSQCLRSLRRPDIHRDSSR